MFGIGGVAKAAFGALSAAVSQEDPVVAQVNMEYAESLGAIPADARRNDLPLLRVTAAQITESAIFLGVEHLVEAISTGQKKFTVQEVRRKVIEQVRDLKLTALELDGNVNPLDLTQIRLQALAFRPKAQTLLTNLCMARKSNVVISPMLDDVESRLIQELNRTHSRDYETWMRAAQAVIYAVADLRFQRMI